MQRLGVLGVAHRPIGECLSGLLQLALLIKQGRESVVRLWEGRWAGHGSAQLRDGSVEVALALQTDPYVVPGVRQLRGDLGGTPVGALCLGRPSGLNVHAAERDPGAAVSRCELEGSRQVLNPLLLGSRVIAEESQTVQRLRIVRIPAQHAAVADLRLGQATGVVGRDGAAEGFVGNGHADFGYRIPRSRAVRAGVDYGGPFRASERPRLQLAPALRGLGR